MSEKEGQNGEGFLSEEEALMAEGRRLGRAVNREESKIVFHGDTDPRTLDKYLEAQIAMQQWQSHHPITSDKAAEAEHHRENALKFTKIFTGSYYTEKAQFCREQADDLIRLGGEKTDAAGFAGRKQGAAWLRMQANCLEMPEPRPPAPGQQSQ